MGKRRPAYNPAQRDFWDVPELRLREAEFAGFEAQVASGVARILRDDMRSREEIAGHMSSLMATEISVPMLAAYAAESRADHNISFARGMVLFAATQRFDVLGDFADRIGVKVLVGEEALTAQLGHIDRQIAQLNDKKKALQKVALPIARSHP